MSERREFCARCRAESTDVGVGSVRTHNGIGRKFYGGANRCADCGSVVRTLWFVIADVPLVPRGSFRYLAVGGEEHSGFFVQQTSQSFLARRTRTHVGQVAATWAIGLAAAAAVVVATILWK